MDGRGKMPDISLVKPNAISTPTTEQGGSRPGSHSPNSSSLDNAQHELFAQRYAAGASATSAYMAAGYEGKGRSAIASAHKLLKHPKVRGRIRDLKSQNAATLINCAIREKNSRLEALQTRWEKLNRLIEQRAVAPELQHVPGGDTGLLVRTRVGIGGDRAVA